MLVLTVLCHILQDLLGHQGHQDLLITTAWDQADTILEGLRFLQEPSHTLTALLAHHTALLVPKCACPITSFRRRRWEDRLRHLLREHRVAWACRG